jgi:polyisoprenoid-binding protein YceI
MFEQGGTKMISMKRILATAAVGFFTAGLAFGGTYQLDVSHSQILFKVKHLGISTVTGKFTDFVGTIDVDPANVSTLKTKATIKTASVDTSNEGRDKHLKSPDFFDAEKHPKITFVSTKAEKLGDNMLKVHGNLTIRGVTKPIVLEGEFGGAADFMGAKRVAFTATGTINRQDFGVNWSKVLDNGGLVVSDQVAIVLEIEGVSKPESE